MDPVILRQTAIFKDLDEAELEQVAEICHEMTFPAGQHIFREGDPGNRLYLVLEGKVRISRDIPGSGEEALSVLQPGACFGEMAVFDRSVRSTDAIADVTCKLATINRPEFEMLLDFQRELAYKVLWAVVRLLNVRLRSTNESLRAFLAMSMF